MYSRGLSRGTELSLQHRKSFLKRRLRRRAGPICNSAGKTVASRAKAPGVSPTDASASCVAPQLVFLGQSARRRENPFPFSPYTFKQAIGLCRLSFAGGPTGHQKAMACPTSCRSSRSRSCLAAATTPSWRSTRIFTGMRCHHFGPKFLPVVGFFRGPKKARFILGSAGRVAPGCPNFSGKNFP